MLEIVKTLERNAKEVRYGSVSVEIHIHDGRVVKTVYVTSNAQMKRNKEATSEKEGVV